MLCMMIYLHQNQRKICYDSAFTYSRNMFLNNGTSDVVCMARKLGEIFGTNYSGRNSYTVSAFAKNIIYIIIIQRRKHAYNRRNIKGAHNQVPRRHHTAGNGQNARIVFFDIGTSGRKIFFGFVFRKRYYRA